MATTVTKYLRWFSKHDQSTTVTISYEAVIDMDGEVTRLMKDTFLQDPDLVEHAEGDGKTTWDEDDICALASLIREPPPPPDVPPEAP